MHDIGSALSNSELLIGMSIYNQQQKLRSSGNRKRPALSRYCCFFLCISACLVFFLSGCVVQSQKVSSEPTNLPQIDSEVFQNTLEKNEQLENENRKLGDKYVQQKKLITELQMRLLKEHTNADNYLQMSERLVNDLLRNKTELLDRGKQDETAKHVVEVIAIIIGTIKINSLDSGQKESLYWAEQYLSESKIEIERKNYEGASYLCRQALEQVQQTGLYTSTHRKQEKTGEIIFLSPLPMKLLKKSNIRKAPSMQAKVTKILEAGSLVTVLGYKGTWVNVSLAEHGKTGWIHYSLLH